VVADFVSTNPPYVATRLSKYCNCLEVNQWVRRFSYEIYIASPCQTAFQRYSHFIHERMIHTRHKHNEYSYECRQPNSCSAATHSAATHSAATRSAAATNHVQRSTAQRNAAQRICEGKNAWYTPVEYATAWRPLGLGRLFTVSLLIWSYLTPRYGRLSYTCYCY